MYLLFSKILLYRFIRKIQLALLLPKNLVMKSILRIVLLITAFHFPVMFSVSVFAMDYEVPTPYNTDCDSAILLSCQNQTSLYSNFINGGAAQLGPSSCLEANPNLELRELWFAIDLTDALSYFLDGYGVNVGFEVYSGNCKNLELVSCHPANGNNTYLSFYAPPVSQYFVRVLGYDYNGGSNFQMVLNCFNPQAACDLSIDQIQIAPCIDADGMVGIDLSGIAHGNAWLDFVSCEILTDDGMYFFDGTRADTTWHVAGEISGTEIFYINVVCGNSENYCSDFVYDVDLPVYGCDTPGSGYLIGTFMWDANCAPRAAKVSFYQPGTAQLLARHDVLIQNNGHFLIADPPEGEFDMLVKVKGCLPKGFRDVQISDDQMNFLNGGILRRGEVSDDNFVNVVDISMVNNWFNKTLPADNPLAHIDLNCDGIVNLVELSIINYSFGMVGDVVPLMD